MKKKLLSGCGVTVVLVVVVVTVLPLCVGAAPSLRGGSAKAEWRRSLLQSQNDAVVGGTLSHFVSELESNALLSPQQAAFLLDHVATDSPKQLWAYLQQETEQGLLQLETLRYLSSLLEIPQEPLQSLENTAAVQAQSTSTTNSSTTSQNTEEDESRHSLPTTILPLTNPAPRHYAAGTLGNVQMLGNANPSPPAPCTEEGSCEQYSGIWGIALGVREYALQCHSNGLHIIDVTFPDRPFRIQYIPMAGGRVYRDVETYSNPATGQTYAYVAAQGTTTTTSSETKDNDDDNNDNEDAGPFYVVDLTILGFSIFPPEPDTNPCPYEQVGYDDRYNDYGHTVTVRQDWLVLNSAGRASKGCQIFDLSTDAWEPVLLTNHSYDGAMRDCHDSWLTPAGNVLYAADGHAGRVRVVDISGLRPPSSASSAAASSSFSGSEQEQDEQRRPPTVLGETPYIANGTYAHSVALTEDGKYLYAFEEHNVYDIAIFDVSDPSNILLVNTFQYSDDNLDDNQKNYRVHSGQVRGHHLLVAYHEAGLRVFDIANPVHPVEVGRLPTHQPVHGTTWSSSQRPRGAWNVYAHLPSGNVLVSDNDYGTYILSVSNTTSTTTTTNSGSDSHHHGMDDHLLGDLDPCQTHEECASGRCGAPDSFYQSLLGIDDTEKTHVCCTTGGLATFSTTKEEDGSEQQQWICHHGQFLPNGAKCANNFYCQSKLCSPNTGQCVGEQVDEETPPQAAGGADASFFANENMEEEEGHGGETSSLLDQINDWADANQENIAAAGDGARDQGGKTLLDRIYEWANANHQKNNNPQDGGAAVAPAGDAANTDTKHDDPATTCVDKDGKTLLDRIPEWAAAAGAANDNNNRNGKGPDEEDNSSMTLLDRIKEWTAANNIFADNNDNNCP